MLRFPSVHNAVLRRIQPAQCPFLSVRSMAYSPKAKKRPSRLVLSTKVARNTSEKKKGPSTLLPAGGLNRRDVGFLPPRPAKRRVVIEPRRERERPRWETEEFGSGRYRTRTEREEPRARREEPRAGREESRPGREESSAGRDNPRYEREKSRTEFKHLKMAQSLATVSRTQRYLALERLQGRTSFQDFGLLPSIQEAIVKDALPELEYREPTPVQKLVISTLLASTERLRMGEKKLETFLVAAETGSGKTLAYTLPLLHHLKQEELELQLKKEQEPPVYPDDPDFEIPKVGSEEDKNGKPRALIIVPTSELVAQVGALLKSLSHIVKFRSALLSREVSGHVLRKRLFYQPVDIVVSTPQLFNSLTDESPNALEKCNHIIVDEADSLFDRSFAPITSSIVSRSENLRRLILCSATIPRSLDTRIRELYPEIKRLVTPNVHVIPRRIQLSIVDVDGELYKGNRMLACADTLYNLAKENTEEGFLKRIIVFVNERKTTAEVAAYLQSKDIDAIALDRDVHDRASSEALAIFTGDKIGVDQFTKRRQRMKVLVTTDITSRGVDTKTVKTVVLYDVPHSSVDFIHRVGRTGRMGRRGRAIVLVDKHANKGWIKDLKMSMYIGGPLI